MARNNSPARRVERAERAATQAAPVVLVDEQPAATLSDRVIRRLCWRARGWAWREARLRTKGERPAPPAPKPRPDFLS